MMYTPAERTVLSVFSRRQEAAKAGIRRILLRARPAVREEILRRLRASVDELEAEVEANRLQETA